MTTARRGKDIYPPSEDTYLLCDVALDEVRANDTVLEVGTGSGVIAEALSGETKTVVASDINPAAVREAYSRELKVVRGDLLEPFEGGFDLVLFNPPYLPEEDETPDDEMATAIEGGEKGTEVTECFLDGVGRVLSPSGRVLVLTSTVSGIEHFENRDDFSAERIASDRYFFEKLVVLRLALP